MNILIVNDFGHINGGAAKVAIESALGLAAAGHNVTFFCSVGPMDARLIANPKIGVECGNRETFLDDSSVIRGALTGWWNIPEYKRLLKSLRQWRKDGRGYDVAHVHGWMKALSPSIFRALEVDSIPTVVTLHDYFISCPNGGFLDYKTNRICERRALSVSCLRCNCDVRSYPQKLWRFGRGIIQEYLSRAKTWPKAYICVSEFQRSKLRSYIKSDKKLCVVRNPLEIGEKSPKGGNANGPVLYVGRLSFEKGVEVGAIAAKITDRQYHVVGDGSYGETLKASLPEVRFWGWQDQATVKNMMRSASVLVFPSRWWETNGLVVLEALAQGVPVAVSDVTGACEVVHRGRNGMIFKSEDGEDLATKLREMLNNWEFFSLNAYNGYWSDPWSVESHVDALVKLYADVI